MLRSFVSYQLAWLVLGLGIALLPRVSAQVGFGTLLQSISNTQAPGVSSVRLPGNPSISANEVVAWSQGEGSGRARSLFNAQTLGILLGDRNGDGLPFDWPDINALEVVAPSSGGQPNQPSPYDLRFSLAADVTNQTGVPIITSGDIIRLAGIGNFATVINRSAFQAALGTSALLNVDGYAELADGAVLVSFVGTGSGNNIINPLTGGTGNPISWTGADVFIIRPPHGVVPALFAYRQSELQTIVSCHYVGYSLSEVAALEEQPNAPYVNNPWDPQNVYSNGTRPRLLWTVGGDDNVFVWKEGTPPCTPNPANPLSSTHNFYAIVGGNNASAAGFTTNTSTFRIVMDALAIWPQTMGSDTRQTLDASNLLPIGGSSLTLTVRSSESSGTRFQVGVAASLEPGLGYLVGNAGYRWLSLNSVDPLLTWSLTSAAAFFMTGPASSEGTASTNALVLPTNIPNTRLYFQAFELSTPFPLGGPLAIRIQ